MQQTSASPAPAIIRPAHSPPWRLILTALGIAIAFIVLNHHAWDGYFQDDELDNLSWAPHLPFSAYLQSMISPLFDKDNFRPVGHLYFALMGRAFGLDFPPWITPVFLFHFANGLLLFLLMRKLLIPQWHALAVVAFFLLSTAAFDAYWKPMYIFDLLCTTLSLSSILLYAYGRWILSFIAFWLAYKSKELAVMIPAVLVFYEYWFGRRKFLVLIPFLLAALSFGLQGILLNPNKHNAYTFHFSLNALRQTGAFYSWRFLMIPFSGLALFALAFIRDRRIWFALLAMVLVMVPLLFLPGRLFEAYTYLPLACAAIALGAAASYIRPEWAWIALAVWMPFNLRQLRHEEHANLNLDGMASVFVDTMYNWAQTYPHPQTLVFDRPPGTYHDWGMTGAWNISNHTEGLPVFWNKSPEGKAALAKEPVTYCHWDAERRQAYFSVRAPG